LKPNHTCAANTQREADGKLVGCLGCKGSKTAKVSY